MSAVLHIVRADARRWGLLIALPLALTVALRLLEERAPILAFQDVSRAGLLEVGQALLTVVSALLLGVCVAAVMQETPVVGRRAFLLTRPVSPQQILLAKLVTLGAAFVVVPALLDFAVLANRGLPLDLVALDALESLVGRRLILLLLLLLVAALTESLVAYLVVLASGVVVLTVAMMLPAALNAPLRTDNWWMAGDEPYSLDTFETTRVWLTMVVTFGAPLVLVARRRRRLAIVVLGVLLALSPMPWWPPLPRLVSPRGIAPPAWAAKPDAPHLVLAPHEASIGAPWAGGGVIPSGKDRRPRTLHARLFFPDVPVEWVASVAELRSRFTLQDGSIIEGHGGKSAPLPRGPDETPLSQFDGWRAILGPDVRARQVKGFRMPSPDARRVLAELEDEAAVSRVTAAPVRYDADVVFELWRFDVAAVVPQRPARIHLDHAVFEIVAIRRDDPRMVSMLVRETVLSPWLHPAIQPWFAVVLKGPDRRETNNGGQNAAPGSPLRALSRIPLARTRWLDTGLGSEWLVVSFLRDDVEPFAPGWIDRAHIAVVDRRYAGRIRRRLRVDDLVVRDQGDDHCR